MGDFALKVSEWVNKTQDKSDQAVRAVAIGLLRGVVLKSPVGNPELWASNAAAAFHNRVADEYNTLIRARRENLTKTGRLKKGLKIDRRTVRGPVGYVGGRFRGNWQVSVGGREDGTLNRIDANGDATIATESAKLGSFKAGPPIFITNNLPYGPRLEYEGWSKQRPAGFVRITIAEFETIMNEQLSALK